MASEAKHTPLPWFLQTSVRLASIHGADGKCVASTGSVYSRGEKECNANAELIVTAVNERATLLAERDAALVAVEGIERFLGIRDGASGLEQIARDIKSGTFPKKSEQTLAEEAEAARLHNLITASIRSGAPGLSETTCSAIAQSVALKIRHAVSSLPTAQVKHGM